MRRLLIGAIIVITMCLFLASFTGTASAGLLKCLDMHCKCYTKGGKHLGGVTVTMCWKWSKLNCEICGGLKQTLKNCNKKYKECNNKCEASDCEEVW